MEFKKGFSIQFQNYSNKFHMITGLQQFLGCRRWLDRDAGGDRRGVHFAAQMSVRGRFEGGIEGKNFLRKFPFSNNLTC
jgi:hypothetical protein